MQTQKIAIELYSHQRQALDLAERHDSFALFMETGTGKTPVAIELIKRRAVQTLVICPLSIVNSVWMDKLQEWAPLTTPVNLWKHRKKLKTDADWEALASDFNHVGIINYESAKKLPEAYLSKIRFIVLDESQRIKDPNSKIAKFLIAPLDGRYPSLCDSTKYRLIMSGTPAPNTPMEYWSQMAVVDRTLLGIHFYKFRAERFFSFGYGNYQWTVRKDSKDWIMNQIKQKAFYISKEDCLDLPDQIFQAKVYQMDAPQSRAYMEMKKTNLLALKEATVISSTELVKIMKLRQITSGFINSSIGKPIMISDNKFKLLQETLDEIPPERQVIIWCQFHYEIEEIMKRLGAQAAALYGELSQTEKQESIDSFIAGKKKYLVANPKTGGVGLTFVNCSYNIYFSLDYSYESFKQSQDRTHRIGQNSKVTYYFLLAQDSIDEVIYKAVSKKRNISEAMLEMIKNETVD